MKKESGEEVKGLKAEVPHTYKTERQKRTSKGGKPMSWEENHQRDLCLGNQMESGCICQDPRIERPK